MQSVCAPRRSSSWRNRRSIERVLVAPGVEDVAGVADGGLKELAGPQHGLHGGLHTGYPVEGVEDAEDVYAGLGALLDEGVDEVVRVAGVATRLLPRRSIWKGMFGIFSRSMTRRSQGDS